MERVLIVYYSRSGNTKKMAELVAEGARGAGGEVTVVPVDKAETRELLDADAIILGSPTYYGHSAGVMRSFLDKSVRYHGKLEGKVGAAFSSAANVGGGNETTVLDLVHALLIHGMIVQGNPNGDHYGPVSIEAPDERASKQCLELGRRTVELVRRLSE